MSGAGEPAGDVVLAIHARAGGFSDRWIAYCEERGIRYRRVDGYATTIMDDLRGCDGFLWHFDQEEATDLLMARSVLAAAEYAGIVVFPNRHTCWHFDDKIAQKYLLEAVGAPLVRTDVFYDRAAALRWLSGQRLPVVRKLRAGAGSANVGLVRTLGDGRAFVSRMFGRGYVAVAGYFQDVRTRSRSVKSRAELVAKLQRAPGAIMRKMRKRAVAARERGYALFQEFAPDNRFDTRVTVVGDRAWAYVRFVREGDFRASGSRNFDVDQKHIDPECVRIAHETARAIGSQSTAFDFVKMADGTPRLVEISYGYVSWMVHSVPGQYDREMNWHPGHLWPEDAHVDDLVAEIRRRRAAGAPAADAAGASR